LCEDLKLINTWFQLVQNIRAKYNIIDSDFYNFDKTGFIIGQIIPGIIVIYADRYNRAKGIQPSRQAKSNSHLYVVPATNLELQYYSRADERNACWSWERFAPQSGVLLGMKVLLPDLEQKATSKLDIKTTRQQELDLGTSPSIQNL
jgi:hypothetical protein